MDPIDLKIIKILQGAGKISNIELSRLVGLSPAPTLERVKKLEKSGIVKNYYAEVDAERLGLGFTALIQVSLTRQVDNAIHNFIDHVNAIEEVVECYQLTGDFDYLLKVMVQNIPAFERLISNKLSKIEEIGSMQTMVVLSKIKDSRVLPIAYEQ